MENYKFIEKLGKGTHGSVYLLKSKKNKYLACKYIGDKHKSHAFREILILGKLNNRRIIKLVDSMVLQNSVFIFLEYINFGSLENMIQFLIKNKIYAPETIAWSLISQISDALNYLHYKKIIHRDIKPANILINKFNLRKKAIFEFKICDFSLSTQKDYADNRTVGTPFYMSPEMINKEDYNESIDCWGLGCCLYELIQLKKTFDGRDRDELFYNIRNKYIYEKITNDLELDYLIKQCLKKRERIFSKELVENEKIKNNLLLMEMKIKEKKMEELERKLKYLR